MALMKWEPFGGLTTLRREVDRLFEDFFDGGPRHVWGRGAAPAVEVCDTTDAVLGQQYRNNPREKNSIERAGATNRGHWCG